MTEQTREAVENYLRNADKKPGESTYHDATTFTKYCKIVVKGITVIDEPAFLYQEAPASGTRCCATDRHRQVLARTVPRELIFKGLRPIDGDRVASCPRRASTTGSLAPRD